MKMLILNQDYKYTNTKLTFEHKLGIDIYLNDENIYYLALTGSDCKISSGEVQKLADFLNNILEIEKKHYGD